MARFVTLLSLAGTAFASSRPHHAATAQEVWSGPKGHIATYLPAVHWSVDTTSLKHLVPSTHGHHLFYTDTGLANPSTRHAFANMSSTLHRPAIVLEHNANVTVVGCDEQGLDLSFTTDTAFDFADETWQSALPFIFVTHSPRCKQIDDGQRIYVLAHDLTFNKASKEVHVSHVEIELARAVSDVDLSWGTHHPTTSPTLATKRQTGTTCGQPPSSTIDGLPAAPCGKGFDRALDDQIGYLDFSDADLSASLENFAPGLKDYNASSYNPDDIKGEHVSNDNSTNSGSVEKRKLKIKIHISVPALLQKVAAPVKNLVKGAAAEIKQVGSAVAGAVKGGINYVEDKVSNLLSPSLDTNAPINLGPKNLVDTEYFGEAFPLYNKNITKGSTTGSIDVYCVECGVHGGLHITGKLKFSIQQLSISEGNVAVGGSIAAGFNIGVHASVEYTPDPFVKEIVQVGIPGFSIPKVIVVGPEAALGADLTVGVAAAGQVLVGVTASLPNIDVVLDLVNKTRTHAKGLTPIFSRNFSASGSVSVNARLGLPLTFGVGFDIIPLGAKGRKLAALINEPAINANLSYATDGDCANGVTYNLGLSDDLNYNVFGLATGSIASVNLASINGCYSLSGNTNGTNDQSIHVNQDVVASTPTATYMTVTTVDWFTPTADASEIASLDNAANAEEDADVDARDEDGFVYNSIQDSTGKFFLSSDTDNNLRLQGASSNAGRAVFASYHNVTVADISQRVFHYYPDEMAAYNVSRFRISFLSKMPKTSDVITLVPLNVDDDSTTKGVYMAVSTAGDYYYTIACNIKDQPAKVFLARDAVLGPQILAGTNVTYTVTGGVVQECSFVPFLSAVGQGLN